MFKSLCFVLGIPRASLTSFFGLENPAIYRVLYKTKGQTGSSQRALLGIVPLLGESKRSTTLQSGRCILRDVCCFPTRSLGEKT